MPFTPSHAVVALPFVRTPLLPAAIAIGAMTPDLPLFLRGTPLSYQATHTNVALSTAIAFVLLVLWYALLRPAVRELAPLAVARRLPPEWDATGSNVLRTLPPRHPVALAGLLIASLVIGVLSHIAWDAFTPRGSVRPSHPAGPRSAVGAAHGIQVGPARVERRRARHPRDLGDLVDLAAYARGIRRPCSARRRASCLVGLAARDPRGGVGIRPPRVRAADGDVDGSASRLSRPASCVRRVGRGHHRTLCRGHRTAEPRSPRMNLAR